jgi:hypothetical protein
MGVRLSSADRQALVYRLSSTPDCAPAASKITTLCQQQPGWDAISLLATLSHFVGSQRTELPVTVSQTFGRATVYDRMLFFRELRQVPTVMAASPSAISVNGYY